MIRQYSTSSLEYFFFEKDFSSFFLLVFRLLPKIYATHQTSFPVDSFDISWMMWLWSPKFVSPKTGAEPEEEEEAISLSEAGQEGEDQVDGEDVDETLPPAHLVAQAPPHQRTDHHGHIHQQTCGHTYKQLSLNNNYTHIGTSEPLHARIGTKNLKTGIGKGTKHFMATRGQPLPLY